MVGVFISYRRSDSGMAAGRLYDALSKTHYPEGQVFRDLYTIHPGEEFPRAIEASLATCDALIAVIGAQWLDQRLNEPGDYVRREIQTALKRRVKVIPVLVEGARMPSAQSLPDDLQDLAQRNALELSDLRWEEDVGRLLQALGKESRRVGTGLEALIELLRLPEVRDAALAVRERGEMAREQIAIVSDYKRLHDAFDKLERSYNVVYREWKRWGAGEPAWEDVEPVEPEVQNDLRALLERALKVSFKAENELWVARLGQAGQLLRAAIDDGDLTRFREALCSIQRVLSREPSRIDTNLAAAAKALQLGALVQELEAMRDRLARLGLQGQDRRNLEEFERELADLTGLHDELTTCVAAHGLFQQIDDVLSPIDVQLNMRDVSALEDTWPDLQALMAVLDRPGNAAWAGEPVKSFAQLAEIRSTNDPARTFRYFSRYRSQELQSFSSVDQDLLDRCEKLRAVGEHLDRVVRMI